MKPKKRIIISSFLALLLSGFIITQIFISCNDQPSTTTETTTAKFTTDIYDSLYYPVYILDAATIMANPELRSNPGTDKSLILKLKFNGLSHDTLDLGLIGYPSSNHADHGQGSDTVLLTRQDTEYQKLPKQLIWGNIYVFWNAIKDQILEPSGAFPRNLIANFSYLKFIPVNHVSGMPWDPYLSYRIEAYKTDGSKIILPGAGSDDSHPSPPAPPSD